MKPFLDAVTIVSGVFSIIFVAISTYVGIRIASKYSELKDKTFLYVGITWVLIVEPWWPSAISFLIALINNSNGLQDTPEIYFIIGNVLLPVALLSWITAFTGLLYKEKQKLIQLFFVIFGVIFEIILFYFIFTDSTFIGVLHGPVDVDYAGFILGFLLGMILMILVTGHLFARESLRTGKPEIMLKGKLLYAAFICFCIGALLDSAIPLNVITLPVTRIVLISSAIFFYGGFILPDWMKKLFLKE